MEAGRWAGRSAQRGCPRHGLAARLVWWCWCRWGRELAPMQPAPVGVHRCSTGRGCWHGLGLVGGAVAVPGSFGWGGFLRSCWASLARMTLFDCVPALLLQLRGWLPRRYRGARCGGGFRFRVRTPVAGRVVGGEGGGGVVATPPRPDPPHAPTCGCGFGEGGCVARRTPHNVVGSSHWQPVCCFSNASEPGQRAVGGGCVGEGGCVQRGNACCADPGFGDRCPRAKRKVRLFHTVS